MSNNSKYILELMLAELTYRRRSLTDIILGRRMSFATDHSMQELLSTLRDKRFILERHSDEALAVIRENKPNGKSDSEYWWSKDKISPRIRFIKKLLNEKRNS